MLCTTSAAHLYLNHVYFLGLRVFLLPVLLEYTGELKQGTAGGPIPFMKSIGQQLLQMGVERPRKHWLQRISPNRA